MPKITLDNVEYNTEDLSDMGRATLASLQFLEEQMKILRNEIAIYQTAQKSYIETFKAEVSTSGIEPVSVKDASYD